MYNSLYTLFQSDDCMILSQSLALQFYLNEEIIIDVFSLVYEILT